MEGLLSMGPTPSSLINDKGVCRTALATPGLLKITLCGRSEFKKKWTKLTLKTLPLWGATLINALGSKLIRLSTSVHHAF